MIGGGGSCRLRPLFQGISISTALPSKLFDDSLNYMNCVVGTTANQIQGFTVLYPGGAVLIP